jgi:hypothetical protein
VIVQVEPGAGSTNLTFALLARDVLGLQVDVVRGYPGAPNLFLAMQSGEVDGPVVALSSLTGTQQALWEGKLAELPFFMALPLVAPPAIPDDRAAALSQAFAAMVVDQAFIDDVRKVNVELSPIDGAAIAVLVARSAATPRDVIRRYNSLIAAPR